MCHVGASLPQALGAAASLLLRRPVHPGQDPALQCGLLSFPGLQSFLFVFFWSPHFLMGILLPRRYPRGALLLRVERGERKRRFLGVPASATGPQLQGSGKARQMGQGSCFIATDQDASQRSGFLKKPSCKAILWIKIYKTTYCEFYFEAPL